LAGAVLAGSVMLAPPASVQPGAHVVAPGLSTPGSGDLIISGDPHAMACQQAAKIGDFKGAGVDECTQALGSPLLHQHDLAATYTDRGAIYMQHRQYEQAKADFDAALKLEPAIANTYIDRGGTLIALKRYAEAIADIDHGLSLGPDQPEKAYFNRAIADEHLKDLKAAYEDYLKASQLNPDWAAPKAELARFSNP
jgi:tetratricopeptide (TPR) repeat protein